MRYFFIGDEVYVPKHKLIGTISDKVFEYGNDEVMLRIVPKEHLSNIAYGNTLRYTPMDVNYSTVRSLRTIDLYQKKMLETDDQELNIPNLLKRRDVIKGTKIKVVDNCFLERMITYIPRSEYLYSRFALSYLLNKEGVLTGDSKLLSNGVLAVECRFETGTYFVYEHSIQIIKRVNFFKRIWNNKYIRTIMGNTALKFACIWTLATVVSLIIYVVVRHFN